MEKRESKSQMEFKLPMGRWRHEADGLSATQVSPPPCLCSHSGKEVAVIPCGPDISFTAGLGDRIRG